MFKSSESAALVTPAKTGAQGRRVRRRLPLDPRFRACEEIETGWIGVLLPSRQPLRGFLRMRIFLNAINGPPHAEERPWARLEARWAPMQRLLVLRGQFRGGDEGMIAGGAGS